MKTLKKLFRLQKKLDKRQTLSVRRNKRENDQSDFWKQQIQSMGRFSGGV